MSGSTKSWSSTLRLPKSLFPPRGQKPSAYEAYRKRCTDDLYKRQAQNRPNAKLFVLHDGPPYANGPLHSGHALNKILKDIICRVELQKGSRIQFVPGWDCHGLPIELKAIQERTGNSEKHVKLNDIKIRQAATRVADIAVEHQKNTFRQWCIMADWDNCWTTKDKAFEMKQLGVFQDMVKKGLIFRRFKPVYWSPSSKTALAEAELEYKEDHVSTSAYVKFPFSNIPESLAAKAGVDVGKLSAVIWTTTPWTLPANRAIALHRDLEYTIVQVDEEQLLIARSRLADVAEKCSFEQRNFRSIVQSIRGSELEGASYTNSLQGNSPDPQPIIFADFVSAESGTGLVHCAPGHGMEDYDVCTKQGIPAFAPVDDAGCFTDTAFPADPSQLRGLSVLDSNEGGAKVLELLGHQVLAIHEYSHKYPYDWRTKLPVIVRATEQWFADVGSIKADALRSLDDVVFIPEAGRARLESFVKGRSEWCISRQRAWGVPLPALYDETGKAVLTDESVAHIVSVIDKRGIDSWWSDPEDDPAWVVPGLEGTYRRGKDTMDVWFDSGTSWTQTDRQADVYLEGTDQHRGWFQSSLLTHASSSGRGVAPFRKLITHGFTLDHQGRKMSKSIGNVIDPVQIMDGTLLPPLPIPKKLRNSGKTETVYDAQGPDALRLWVASGDYTRDVAIGLPILKAVNITITKLRTTFKMLLGSMQVDSREMPLTTLDKIALVQLEKALVAVSDAFDAYDFYKAVSIITRYVNTDLSAFYIEAMKDRLYCGDGGGVLPHIYDGLMQMLSPITPMLVEEAWHHKPQWMDESRLGHPLERVPDRLRPLNLDKSLYANIEPAIPLILSVHSAIKTAQEQARLAKTLGSSLQCSVQLCVPPESMATLKECESELEAIFVVSSVELLSEDRGDNIDGVYTAEFDAPGGKGIARILPPKEQKCPRCWRYVAPVEDVLCKRCEDVVETL